MIQTMNNTLYRTLKVSMADMSNGEMMHPIKPHASSYAHMDGTPATPESRTSPGYGTLRLNTLSVLDEESRKRQLALHR